MPGISEMRAVSDSDSSAIKAGSDDAGNPSGKTASAIPLARTLLRLELKIAPSSLCKNLSQKELSLAGLTNSQPHSTTERAQGDHETATSGTAIVRPTYQYRT